MTPFLPRRRLLQTSFALGAALVLPRARACEFFTTSLRITHPWTRASAEGDRFAIVNMKFDEVTRADRLVGVETPVAESADMGGAQAGPKVDFFIPEGQNSALSESGTFLRLVDLKFPMLPGREFPLKLVFEQAGPVATTLTVDYARFK